LPVEATLSAGAKLIAAGTLRRGSASRHSLRISSFSSICLEYHVGDGDRAGDRILLRPHQRHTHLRMPLITASISSGCTLNPPILMMPPLRPAKSAVAAPLDDIAGVDETVRVGELLLAADIAGCGPAYVGGARDGVEMKISDGTLRIRYGNAIVDIEGDAGLSRGVSVADRGIRKRRVLSRIAWSAISPESRM